MAFHPANNSMHKKLLKALGLEGRCVKRVVIDIAINDVARVVVTEFADGEQIDRVIELIDSAEKHEVDAEDSMILQGDPRIEEPKGMLFAPITLEAKDLPFREVQSPFVTLVDDTPKPTVVEPPNTPSEKGRPNWQPMLAMNKRAKRFDGLTMWNRHLIIEQHQYTPPPDSLWEDVRGVSHE